MNARKNKKGQTMLEYIIIVALIAISLNAVFTYFGRATAKKVAGATEAISEEEGSKAREAADNISEETSKKRGENRSRLWRPQPRQSCGTAAAAGRQHLSTYLCSLRCLLLFLRLSIS